MNYLDQWHGVSQLTLDGSRPSPRRVYMFGDSPDSGNLPQHPAYFGR